MADSFGELLRGFRIAASLTQEALAERCRISPNTIASIEQGRRKTPRLSTVALIADALNLAPADREALALAATGGSPHLVAVPAPAALTGAVLPDWSSRWRAAAGRPRPRGTLPATITPLFGRHAEVTAVAHELGSERLVTLTGPGGVGKTRLALEVAASTLDKFPAGTYWTELGRITDPGGVRGALLRSLGVAEHPRVPLAEQLLGALPAERSLLVVDNCEHVLDAAATVTAELLTHPAAVVLATSREPLGIPGEVRWQVPPLTVPPANGPVTAEALSRIDSVQMFAERASRVNPAFTMTDADAAPIARICQRLEGIPLAIELAAARLGSQPPGPLADELGEEIRLAHVTARGVPERHATLWASIAWSYRLLSAEDQAAFRGLACFADSFTDTAFAAVTGSAAPPGALPRAGALYRLAAKSLVSAEREPGRYRVLDSIRAFAADQARDAGELTAVRDAHADYYASWVSSLGARDATDGVLDLIEADYPNLSAAIAWSAETGSLRAAAIVAAMGVAWQERAHFHDARVLGDAALQVASGRDPEAWSRAVASLAMARLLGSMDFLPAVSQALVIAEAGGDRYTEGMCRLALGSRPPFDGVQLARAHELGSAGSFGILATLGAIFLAYGGTEKKREDWLHRADEYGGGLNNSTLRAARRLAWADSLLERGRLADAVEIAEPAVFDTQVMPTTRLLGIGRTLLVALHSRDLDLAELAATMNDELAYRWPIGVAWTTSSWAAFGGLLRMWWALLRGEKPPALELGTLGQATRMGLTPSAVRTVCRAAIDRGDFLEPAEVAHGAGPPAVGSLMAASFDALQGARATIEGDAKLAGRHWLDALEVAAPNEYLLLVCDALEGLGVLAAREGDTVPAASMLAAAARCRQDTGYRHRFGFEARLIQTARAAVGPAAQGQPPPSWQEAAEAALSGHRQH
jgi:predicted ATPase/transcriptional regulator with XRE-family HTH domain